MPSIEYVGLSVRVLFLFQATCREANFGSWCVSGFGIHNTLVPTKQNTLVTNVFYLDFHCSSSDSFVLTSSLKWAIKTSTAFSSFNGSNFSSVVSGFLSTNSKLLFEGESYFPVINNVRIYDLFWAILIGNIPPTIIFPSSFSCSIGYLGFFQQVILVNPISNLHVWSYLFGTDVGVL